MAPKIAKVSEGNDSTPFRLPYFGPARLEHQGRIVKLRRKSLAILYYLAVEGPTRRQALADLLWVQYDSSQNLRVELHNLKKTLGRLDTSLFNGTRDPVTLPASIELDKREATGEPLEGLEDLAPEFHNWLEQQRAKANRPRQVSFVHSDLVSEMARRVKLPYLLILSGQPGSGHYRFAESLAASLGLPITNEVDGATPAVRYLGDPHDQDARSVGRILGDGSNVWVLERSTFSEDPEFLLRLRSSIPPDRISYLELPPLSWQEVAAQLRTPLPFRQAAELFCSTGGHPGFLRELLALRAAKGIEEAPALPQRVRAAYQLEARSLDADARFALERASVHPGPLSDGLLSALEIEPQLIELARRNWLIYDDGWRFNGNVARTVIYLSLPPGHARLHHQVAARQLSSDGQHVAAAYHRSMFEGRPDWEQIGLQADGWVQRLAMERLGVVSPCEAPQVDSALLEEVPLLETDVFGRHVENSSGAILITRQPLESDRSGVEWQLPPESGVLHIKGRIYASSVLDVGLRADATPLRIDLLGPEPGTVVFADVRTAQTLADGTLLLPLAGGELDCYLRFDPGLLLRIWSAAEAAVVELTATVYRTGPASAGRTVRAYELGRLHRRAKAARRALEIPIP